MDIELAVRETQAGVLLKGKSSGRRVEQALMQFPILGDSRTLPMADGWLHRVDGIATFQE